MKSYAKGKHKEVSNNEGCLNDSWTVKESLPGMLKFDSWKIGIRQVKAEGMLGRVEGSGSQEWLQLMLSNEPGGEESDHKY